MQNALRLGSIFRIAIFVHFTWLLIFALVTFSQPLYRLHVAQIAVLEDEQFLGLIGRKQLLHLIRNRLELVV